MDRKVRSDTMIYSYAPKAQVQLLDAFRQRCQQKWMVDGQVGLWDMGEGASALIFLPGGMGVGEIYFPFLLRLGNQMRCVAVTYPHIGDLDGLCKVLHAAFEESGIQTMRFVATSIGGVIAQRYAQLYPEAVKGLFLICSTAPTPETPPEVARRRTSARPTLRMRFLPFSSMGAALANSAFRRFCPEPHRERCTFWEAYIEDVYQNQVYKKLHLALNYDLPKCIYHQQWTEKEVQKVTKNIRIIHSEEDVVFSSGERNALNHLYPHATVENLSGGQFVPMIHETRLIDDLLLWGKGE